MKLLEYNSVVDGLPHPRGQPAPPQKEKRALVAVTLDLEMSRNFPTWEQTHWDYEKGNLNVETKRYTALALK